MPHKLWIDCKYLRNPVNINIEYLQNTVNSDAVIVVTAGMDVLVLYQLENSEASFDKGIIVW